jgi:hypothetical protein
MESELMYSLKGEVPSGEHVIPLGVADVKRPGDDVTIVTWGKMVHTALKAAEELAGGGVAAEVLDLRTDPPARHGGDPRLRAEDAPPPRRAGGLAVRRRRGRGHHARRA